MPYCDICYNFSVKMMFGASRLICFVGGSFLYKCYLYLFTHTGIQYDFHIRWSWHWTATWWVPLVKQELFTLFIAPEFISFSGVCVAQSLVFWFIVCLFVPFFLAIVLSVLFTSEYYIGIFKLFSSCVSIFIQTLINQVEYLGYNDITKQQS